MALIGAAALLGLLAVGPSVAAQPTHINVDATGLALYGYDPVSYVSDNKAVPGDAAVTAVHDGATYRFASAEHRDSFTKDPAKYLPAYGGFCAYGVTQGYKVKVDPAVFKVVDGRLYLNYNASVGEKWSSDVPGYISKAEKVWPELSKKPVQ
jgi:YHS domain-containing protein